MRGISVLSSHWPWVQARAESADHVDMPAVMEAVYTTVQVMGAQPVLPVL